MFAATIRLVVTLTPALNASQAQEFISQDLTKLKWIDLAAGFLKAMFLIDILGASVNALTILTARASNPTSLLIFAHAALTTRTVQTTTLVTANVVAVWSVLAAVVVSTWTETTHASTLRATLAWNLTSMRMPRRAVLKLEETSAATIGGSSPITAPLVASLAAPCVESQFLVNHRTFSTQHPTKCPTLLGSGKPTQLLLALALLCLVFLLHRRSSEEASMAVLLASMAEAFPPL